MQLSRNSAQLLSGYILSITGYVLYKVLKLDDYRILLDLGGIIFWGAIFGQVISEIFKPKP